MIERTQKYSRLFSMFNAWVAVPVAVLVLATAEFSRYTPVLPGWLRPLLAERTLLVAMILAVVTWLALGLHARAIKLRPADAWWLGVPVLLGVWSLLGLVWSPSAGATSYLAEFWLYGLAITLVLGVIGQPIRNRWWLAGAAFVGVALVIGIGLVEKITDTHLAFSNLANPYREQWALTSVFINQNHLAACVAIFLPLIVAAALSYRRLRWPLFALAAGGLVVLFFTGSTLAWLGLLLSAAVFGVIELVFARRMRSARKVLVGLAVAFIAVLVIGGTWFALPSSIRDRFSVAAEGVSKSVHERTTLLQVGVSLVLQHPLRGLGPAAAESGVRAAGRTRVQNLHDLLLEVAVNFGLPALTLLLAWIVAMAVALAGWLRRAQSIDAREFHRAAAVLAALAGLLLVQAAPSTFMGVRAPWILLGLALALVRDHVRDGDNDGVGSRY